MKKFTLLTCIILLSTITFGQAQVNSTGAMVKQSDQTKYSNSLQQKAGGDLIWQETFDWADPENPQGWTLPDGWTIADNLDLGNYWIWLQDSIKGRWTSEVAPDYFQSPEDGFICVPMDQYNYRDEVATNNVSDTYIETPPIDCSGVSSVVVRLNQYYRFCCENDNTGHMQLMVTVDDGVRWAYYDLSFGIGHNTFTPEKFRSPEYNISDLAAGSPNVKIRIYFYDVPAYFWAIDDLTLTEAYDNDLKLDDSWVEMNAGFQDPIGHVNYIPMDQIGMASEVAGFVGDQTFRGAFTNNGMNDAEDARLNVEILHNGTEVLNENSDFSQIWSLESDTLGVDEGFLPTEYGDYQVTLTAEMNNEEEVPDDNSEVYNFTINDSLYQRADMSAEATTSTRQWANGNTAGDMLAVRYDITAPVEVNSISAHIRWFDPDVFPSFQFVLLKYMEEEDEMVEVNTSDVIDMDSTYLGYVTLPLTKDGESEFLEPGEYYAAWRAWADDDVVGMRLGWDQNARADFTSHNLIYLISITTWYSSDKVPILGLNFNTEGGPTEADATFNVDMNNHINNGEFTPGVDFVDIAGSFNGWGAEDVMSDEDGDGIYTLTLSGMPVGEDIEYKYRINGNWDTSEFPDGGPNRVYTVRYWNVINDVYNGGVTTGIPSDELSSDVSVFPNPSNGRFTVRFNNSTAINAEVSIINLSGQVVYTRQLSNVVSGSHTVDSQLPKGLYFLRVSDGKNVKLHKVLVQ